MESTQLMWPTLMRLFSVTLVQYRVGVVDDHTPLEKIGMVYGHHYQF